MNHRRKTKKTNTIQSSYKFTRCTAPSVGLLSNLGNYGGKKKDAKTDTPDWWHGKKIHRQECCVFCNIREGKKETTRCVGVVGSDTSERVSGAVILSA